MKSLMLVTNYRAYSIFSFEMKTFEIPNHIIKGNFAIGKFFFYPWC